MFFNKKIIIKGGFRTNFLLKKGWERFRGFTALQRERKKNLVFWGVISERAQFELRNIGVKGGRGRSFFHFWNFSLIGFLCNWKRKDSSKKLYIYNCHDNEKVSLGVSEGEWCTILSRISLSLPCAFYPQVWCLGKSTYQTQPFFWFLNWKKKREQEVYIVLIISNRSMSHQSSDLKEFKQKTHRVETNWSCWSLVTKRFEGESWVSATRVPFFFCLFSSCSFEGKWKSCSFMEEAQKFDAFQCFLVFWMKRLLLYL